VGVTLAARLFVLLMALVLGAGQATSAEWAHLPSSTNCYLHLCFVNRPALMWGDERLESLGQLGADVWDVRRRIGMPVFLSAIFGRTGACSTRSPTALGPLRAELPSHLPLSPFAPSLQSLAPASPCLILRPSRHWHVHARDGACVRAVVGATARSSRPGDRDAICPAVHHGGRRRRYRQRIWRVASLPAIPCAGRFHTLDDGYLTDSIDQPNWSGGFADGDVQRRPRSIRQCTPIQRAG